MKDIHLSDLNIQEFVLNRSDSQVDTLTHLETCGHCRTKADQYRLLVSSIEGQAKPKFDFNLTELVLASVITTKTYKRINAIVYSLSALGLLVIVLVLLLFMENATVIFDGFKKITLYLLFVTTLVIAGFLGLEIYTGYTKKIKALKFSN